VGIVIPEDDMNRFATAAATLILIVGMACWSFAFETDFQDVNQFDTNLPGWKFGRGVANIVGGPNEFFTAVTNNAIKGAWQGAYSEGLPGYLGGSLNGGIAGVGPGIVNSLRRMTTGALEILTFWKPEYGPTMNPTYSTRALNWGAQDYFDPDPFWYNGPAR
jgi:hypothetical protein